MARETQTLRIGSRSLQISNPHKVLWPQDGITKGDLIAYYRSVSAWLLPHLRERPLTMQRWPEGIAAASFFEKQAPRYTPDWIPTVALAAEEGAREIAYPICNEEAALAWCANLAAIVLHVWYSRRASIENPDYVLFDLDTGERTTAKTLATVALAFRDELRAIGLDALVKTSGGSGLHVVVPLRTRYTYDAAKQFARIVAEHVGALLPELTTLERTLARRPATAVYLDWVQVGRGKTVVPPYVVRARDGAPVSMPLDWSEVEEMRAKRRSPEALLAQWNVRNARARLESNGDAWGGPKWKPAALEPALKKAQRAWA